MTDALPSFRVAARLTGGVLVSIATFVLPPRGTAVAFPIADPSNQGVAPTTSPTGTELPAQDVRGLQEQGRLINRPAVTNGSGLLIVPRLTIQELFTDNAYESTAHRRFDAITVLAPGISISADTPRVQLQLDYHPNLILHAINGPLNAVTQSLNAVGLVTVVPDLAYVDVRALSGVQPRLGGLVGTSTLGSADTASTGTITAANVAGTAGGYYGGDGQSLNRDNLVQTTSFGISPYLLRQFGDYGTGKLGASANYSRYSSLSGFAAAPIPIGGNNGQSLFTTEQLLQFTSGQILGRVQDSLSVDISQSSTRQDAANGIPSSSFYSHRETASNQVSYAVNRVFTIQGAIGYEDITYPNNFGPHIHGLTWNAGGTITPDPNSSLTVTYGRQNGATSATAHGHYAVTARTLLSIDYTNTVGTQLENLQGQINGTTLNANGQAINAQTGGPQFLASNGLGVQNGVFRFRTFNASVQTTLDRDTIAAVFTWSDQSTLTGATNTTDYKTVGVSWAHELTPDLTFSTGASYSLIRRSSSGITPGGSDNAYSAAVALRYLISPTLTFSARYSFFDRISGIPGYSMYENALLLSVTKQF